jgi:hypothetical protein
MYHFFSHKNLLNIDEDTEVVMGKYQVDADKPAVLVVLHYPDETTAAAAHDTYKRTFMADAQEVYTRGSDELWTGCISNDNLLVIVVDAPSRSAAQELVEGVEQI